LLFELNHPLSDRLNLIINSPFFAITSFIFTGTSGSQLTVSKLLCHNINFELSIQGSSSFLAVIIIFSFENFVQISFSIFLSSNTCSLALL
jgi:hypothetical protein